jgi:hypothetical protein
MITWILLGISVFCFGFGIYRFKGPVSVWYIAYGVGSVEVNYISIPLGINVASLALATSTFIPGNWKIPVIFLGTGSLIGGFIFARRLFKPTWLRWLEKKHGGIMPILQNEIQRIGPESWDYKINTQEELEAWVAEVRRKHNLT